MFDLERTFVVVKPDGVKRGLVGEVIRRFEDKGFKVVALKMLNATQAQAELHYEEHKGKDFYGRLVKYIQSGPIAAMVLEGHNVIAGSRHIIGKTDPMEAELGTIRADLAISKSYNTVHGSDSLESAKRETDIYFKPEEICGGWPNMTDLVIERLQLNEQQVQLQA